MEKHSNFKVKVGAIFVVKITVWTKQAFLKKKKDEERSDGEFDAHPLSRLLSGWYTSYLFTLCKTFWGSITCMS